MDAIVSSIPARTQSILDVGCGDGLVTNELVEAGFAVTGVDIVPGLLRFVHAPTVEASCEALPFPDRSFDCVVASAVLEHLPAGMFESSLRELERVASRYLVIDCPHRERLVLMQARCGRCASTFHASHHVRSVDEADVESWFPGFELRTLQLTGEPWPYRSRRLQQLAQLLGNLWYRGDGIVCPTCGYAVEPPAPRPLVRIVNGGLQRLLGLLQGSRPSEMIVVLERAPEGPRGDGATAPSRDTDA